MRLALHCQLHLSHPRAYEKLYSVMRNVSIAAPMSVEHDLTDEEIEEVHNRAYFSYGCDELNQISRNKPHTEATP